MKHVEERVLRLERTLRLLVAVLVLGVVVSVATGAVHNKEERVTRVERLELVDQEGHVRAVLGFNHDGTAGLFLRDSTGGLRASLVHDASESALYLYDSTQTVRVGVAQFAHGGGGIALHGPHSRGAAALYFKSRGTLSFYDTAGTVLLRIPEAPERGKVK